MRTMKNKGFVVLWAAVGINFLTGMLYTWSVISKALINVLGWTSKEASLPYTISTIFFVISMVIFGKVQDKKGPRVTSTIGSILVGSGFILSGFTHSPIVMLFTIGIIAGSGIGIITVSTTPPTVKWFSPEEKGRITGTVVAGVGLSSVFYSPLANYLLTKVGINKTFIIIGSLVLVITTILSQLLANPPEDYVVESNSSKKLVKIQKVKDFTGKEMLRTPYFYKLWIMFSFSSSAGLMIIGHISTISKTQVNWEGGFILVMFLAIFNTLGRFLGGIFSDKIGRNNLMRIMFMLQGLNMGLFPFYKSIPLLFVGASIAGLCYGAGFSVFPSAISDTYGTKYFGINYGLIFTAWGIGGIIGPMTGATIYDFTNNYNMAYLVAMVLLIISSAIAFTIKANELGSKAIEET